MNNNYSLFEQASIAAVVAAGHKLHTVADTLLKLHKPVSDIVAVPVVLEQIRSHLEEAGDRTGSLMVELRSFAVADKKVELVRHSP